jgi:HD superfamily phosphodiesterase
LSGFSLRRLQELLEILTLAQNEAWAVPHARRVLKLAEHIANSPDFDKAVLLSAVYLHDWGAFTAFRLPGVDHPLRSRQIIEENLLQRLPLSQDQAAKLLDCVALHDYRDPRPASSLEALLLREADALDLLGAVGIAREYAWGPNDVEKVTARIRARMQALSSWFILPKARTIAARRLSEMEAFLGALEDELNSV